MLSVPQLLAIPAALQSAWLQESALITIKTAVEAFERPAFPCALIAGDVVILNLLHRLGYLKTDRVSIIFIDTFHLFQETHDFLHRLEVPCVLLCSLRSVCCVLCVLHYLQRAPVQLLEYLSSEQRGAMSPENCDSFVIEHKRCQEDQSLLESPNLGCAQHGSNLVQYCTMEAMSYH